MSPVIDRETIITLFLGGISRNLGKIRVFLTSSRAYDLPMTTNSLGCPSTELEEIRENKAIKLDLYTCLTANGTEHHLLLQWSLIGRR